jgi:hypothetical protein
VASIPGLFIGLACDRGMRSYTPHKQRRNDNQRGQGNHLNKAGDRFESGRKALLSLLRFVAFEIRFAYNSLSLSPPLCKAAYRNNCDDRKHCVYPFIPSVEIARDDR